MEVEPKAERAKQSRTRYGNVASKRQQRRTTIFVPTSPPGRRRDEEEDDNRPALNYHNEQKEQE